LIVLNYFKFFFERSGADFFGTAPEEKSPDFRRSLGILSVSVRAFLALLVVSRSNGVHVETTLGSLRNRPSLDE